MRRGMVWISGKFELRRQLVVYGEAPASVLIQLGRRSRRDSPANLRHRLLGRNVR
jgi:hypothetical protein